MSEAPPSAPPVAEAPPPESRTSPPPRVSALAALRDLGSWARGALRGYERAIVAGLAVAAGVLFVFFALRRHETGLIRASLDAEGRSVKMELEQALAAHTSVALQLARHWERMPYDRAAFAQEVESIMASEPVFRGFEWRNAAFDRVATEPGTLRMPGADLDSTEHSDIEVAAAWVGDHPEGSPSPTFESGRGRRLIAFAAPLFDGETTTGVIAGVARLRDVLDQALTAADARGMRVSVREGNERLYGPEPARDGAAGRLMRTITVTSGDLNWEVESWPSPERLGRMRSFAPPVVLLVGLFAALGAAVALAPARPRA